jgi:hypothetical protein
MFFSVSPVLVENVGFYSPAKKILWLGFSYIKVLCISLKANPNRTRPKIRRIVWPFNFSAIILDPSCPPTKEKTAAISMNFQSVSAREMCVMNPLNDENMTTKMLLAAAVLVGTFRT